MKKAEDESKLCRKCSRLKGGQPGNQNARKHGTSSAVFLKEKELVKSLLAGMRELRCFVVPR